ncbi:carboxylesterase [Roseibium aquae]|uniref:Carboxylesterase n=1 Tax=Roseibium aquae TaxID=1323746 RepID=A0A916X2I4_9HYPH|nr:alpha/beta hydrolase [Roseibium aquae]GGB63817.1 carboxylesterase [Roseibium aquae]
MDLPYRRAGCGKPLVLVHGYLGGSAQWEAQMSALSGTHDVIAPDLPGFGQAAYMAGPSCIADFAAAVMGCLDRLGVDSFTLLGHSMGGMIVQEIAARHPGRLEALVLYGTGPLGLMPDRFEPVETSLARLDADGVQASADRISAMWFRNGTSAQGYVPIRDVARLANPDAARNALIAMRDWDGRPALQNFSMPCRIIWGDQDRSYRWPQPESLWRGIAGAELCVIPAASHAVHIEKPDLFNAVLRDFL